MSTSLAPENITVGTAYGVGLWTADTETAYPASASADWGVGWSSLGYVADDGLPTLGASTESVDIMGWQSQAALRTVITKRIVTLGFTLIETSPENLALYFDSTAVGDEVPLSATPSNTERMLGIDIRDGDQALRIILFRTMLDSVGDMVFDKGAAVPLPVVFKCLDDGNGEFGTSFRSTVVAS